MGTRATPAEALVRVPQAVLSHESAARVLGIELLDDQGVDRLTVPRSHSHVALPGWRIRRADCSGPELLLPDNGWRLTSPARTLCDLARVLPLADAVGAADSALRQRLLAAGLLHGALTAARGPGSGRLHRVSALADPHAESVLESALRVLLPTSALPAPRVQHAIVGSRGRGIRVDFCWPEARLVVEADGFAFHSDRTAYRRDRERMNELERLGWRVLRFTFEDVLGRPAYVLGLVAECLALPAAA